MPNSDPKIEVSAEPQIYTVYTHLHHLINLMRVNRGFCAVQNDFDFNKKREKDDDRERPAEGGC